MVKLKNTEECLKSELKIIRFHCLRILTSQISILILYLLKKSEPRLSMLFSPGSELFKFQSDKAVRSGGDVQCCFKNN